MSTSGGDEAAAALSIGERLGDVRGALAEAIRRAGRQPTDVRLVAVSKTHPTAAIRAALAHEQQDFGENYAQELRDKHRELGGVTTPSGASLRWHFIGPVQSNKVKYLVGAAHLIHGVSSLGALEEIERKAAARGVVQDCLVQVNVVEEAAKQGVPPSGLASLLDAFAPLGHTRCRGLMLIPPFSEDAEQSRAPFAALRHLAERERAIVRPNVDLKELSMGMSGDFLVAVEEGATLVRVGTAIFGARPPAG